jgi:hypothetical protein
MIMKDNDRKPESTKRAESPLARSDPSGVGWKPQFDTARGSAEAAYEPEPAEPRVSRRDSGGLLQGEVRGFRERRDTESDLNPLVWTFRLERYVDGARLPPIPVEMRGASFTGFITEGDTVALSDAWHEGQVVQAKLVYNVTSGMAVRALDPLETFEHSMKSSSPFHRNLLITLSVVFVVIFLGMFLNMWSMSRDMKSFSPPAPAPIETPENPKHPEIPERPETGTTQAPTVEMPPQTPPVVEPAGDDPAATPELRGAPSKAEGKGERPRVRVRQ